MKGTFVYGDRTPPAGTAIPGENAVVRHKKIFSTETNLEEGDNSATLEVKGDEVSVFFSRPGAAHGAPAVLWAMSRLAGSVEGLMDTVLGDVDSLHDAGLCPGDIPARAITYSVWERRFPKAQNDAGLDVLVAIDNSIHGGFVALSLAEMRSRLALRDTNKRQYTQWLMSVLDDLATTDSIRSDS